ncbi:hypothetical protein K2X33_07355 [bacterium]|nr:hypothetical protein [bacterium]
MKNFWYNCWKTLGLGLLACSGLQASDVKVYGFVLPTWTAASSGVESFSQPNMGAYTAAGNPAMATLATDVRSSFQVAQSRIGANFQVDPKAKANLEFDFIDFTKASPTTGAMPRVRRAFAEYGVSDNLLLRFGQDWDIVSPSAPFSYNYVGHYFESGDIGFMRIQAQAFLTTGNVEHAIALGLPGNNNAAADSGLELTVMPTLAVRETWKLADGGQVGVSALGTVIRLSKTTYDRAFAGAVTGFFQTPSTGKFEVHAEAYLGQNTNNLGMLGLGFANTSSPNVQEAGAYVSAKYHLSETLGIFGGIGGSWVLNPSGMPASYTRTPTLALNSSGPGIESNLTLRGGLDYALMKGAFVFGEVGGLVTRHHLLAGDVMDPNAAAVIVQVGTQLSI